MTIRTSRGSGIIAAVAFFVFFVSSTAMAAVIWTTEMVDSNGNAGLYNSLALDTMGNPHISYFSQSYASEFVDLKYAYKSGGIWHIETVDSVYTAGSISLVLDSHANPHISYTPNSSSYSPGILKYAVKIGDVWQTETIDNNGSVPCSSLAVDSSGTRHISYIVDDWDAGGSFALKYASKSGGGWQIETVNSDQGGGVSTSLALDSSGNPRIGFSYNDYDTIVGYASKSGDSWQIEKLALGAFPTLALDGSGIPHISYVSNGLGEDPLLNYTVKTGDIWQTETADSKNTYPYTISSLTLDSSGNPHISYTTGPPYPVYFTLKYAFKTVDSWQTETVDSSADVGMYNSLALDKSSGPHISYYDNTNHHLKYALRTNTMSLRNQFYRSFLRTRRTVWMVLIADGQQSNQQDRSITIVGPGDNFQGVSVNEAKRVFSLGKLLYIPLIIDKGATLGQWKIICTFSLPEAGQVKRIEESFTIQ